MCSGISVKIDALPDKAISTVMAIQQPCKQAKGARLTRGRP